MSEVRGTLNPLDKRSLTAIENRAKEILRQCEHLRRNAAGDEQRFGWIHVLALRATGEALRAYKRYGRDQGWAER